MTATMTAASWYGGASRNAARITPTTKTIPSIALSVNWCSFIALDSSRVASVQLAYSDAGSLKNCVAGLFLPVALVGDSVCRIEPIIFVPASP